MTKVSRKEPYGIPLGKCRLKKALKKSERDTWVSDYLDKYLTPASIYTDFITTQKTLRSMKYKENP